ncbi:MAG: hypothetical protein ACOC5K_00850 [Chloroflexota bacterium]
MTLSGASVFGVEDEPEIMEVISTILALDGHDVTEAAIAVKGLRVFVQKRQHPASAAPGVHP